MSWSLEQVIARLMEFNSYNIHVHCSVLTLTLESQNCIKILIKIMSNMTYLRAFRGVQEKKKILEFCIETTCAFQSK